MKQMHDPLYSTEPYPSTVPAFPSQIGLLLTIVEFFIYELHFYFLTYLLKLRYGDSADNTVEENSSIVRNPNALVTVSKGMWAAKLCTNKILIFNWRCQLMQADLYNGLRGWL